MVMVILAKQNHIDSILETISNLDSFQPVFELDVEAIIAETVVSFGMLASELMGQNLEMPTKVDAIFGCPCLSLKLISRKYNLMLTDCVQAAWDEIKDRKGRMINGVFVKEGIYNGTIFFNQRDRADGHLFGSNSETLDF